MENGCGLQKKVMTPRRYNNITVYTSWLNSVLQKAISYINNRLLVQFKIYLEKRATKTGKSDKILQTQPKEFMYTYKGLIPLSKFVG